MDGEGRRIGISEVQQAISRTLVPGVRNLTVQQAGEKFEICGEADTTAERDNAFRLLTDKLGSALLVNGIQISSE